MVGGDLRPDVPRPVWSRVQPQQEGGLWVEFDESVQVTVAEGPVWFCAARLHAGGPERHGVEVDAHLAREGGLGLEVPGLAPFPDVGVVEECKRDAG